MPRASARIHAHEITDWDSFHTVFAQVMGFPSFYGRNMNAWIDCMTYFDDNMTRFNLNPGEIFELEIVNTRDFASRIPEIFDALIDAVACVNTRQLEAGSAPMISLLLL